MRPVILSVVVVLLARISVNASVQEVERGSFDGNFVCGRDILRTEVMHVVEPGTLIMDRHVGQSNTALTGSGIKRIKHRLTSVAATGFVVCAESA